MDESICEMLLLMASPLFGIADKETTARTLSAEWKLGSCSRDSRSNQVLAIGEAKSEVGLRLTLGLIDTWPIDLLGLLLSPA